MTDVDDAIGACDDVGDVDRIADTGVLVLSSLTGATGALWTSHTRAGMTARPS